MQLRHLETCLGVSGILLSDSTGEPSLMTSGDLGGILTCLRPFLAATYTHHSARQDNDTKEYGGRSQSYGHGARKLGKEVVRNRWLRRAGSHCVGVEMLESAVRVQW